jgi:hypothetical protein
MPARPILRRGFLPFLDLYIALRPTVKYVAVPGERQVFDGVQIHSGRLDLLAGLRQFSVLQMQRSGGAATARQSRAAGYCVGGSQLPAEAQQLVADRATAIQSHSHEDSPFNDAGYGL